MYKVPKKHRRLCCPVFTKKYEKFKGVDFTSDITKVDSCRSPYACNIISDEGGNPVKRMGFADVSEGKEVFIGDGVQTVFTTAQDDLSTATVTVNSMQTTDFSLSAAQNIYSVSGVSNIGANAYCAFYDKDKVIMPVPFRPQISGAVVQQITAPLNAAFLRWSVKDEDINSLRIVKGVESIQIPDLTVYKNLSFTKWLNVYESENKLHINVINQTGANVIFNCSGVDWSNYRYIFVGGNVGEGLQGNSSIKFSVGYDRVFTSTAADWAGGVNRYINIPNGVSGNLKIVVDCPQGNVDFIVNCIKLTSGTVQEGNLFDNAKITVNKFLDVSGAEQTVGGGDWNISDYISITPAKTNLIFSFAPIGEIVLSYKQYTKRINGIFPYKNGMVVHSGDNLYYRTGNFQGEIIKTGIADRLSSSFTYNDKLYILTGEEYLVFDGVSCDEVSGFVPTTSIDNEIFQPINLLCSHRKNLFSGDGVNKIFYLDDTPDAESTVTVTVNNVPTTAFVRDQNKITFTNAPATAYPMGIPNIVMEYIRTLEGRAERIKKCTFAALYANRVFFSGNPDYPSHDWCCEEGNPTYFPDTLYSVIGNNSSAIMGYLKIKEDLGIIKSDGIFLRTYSPGGSFSIKEGAEIGAVSKSCCTLVDDPLIITSQGVYGVGNNGVSVQKRSTFVDARLTKESNLKNAFACIWSGYYLLFVNNNVYVADSRQRVFNNKPIGTFEYEWYFWDSIFAVCASVISNSLYFGSADGMLCKFHTNAASNKSYNDNGKAISAVWSTPLEDDGDFMSFKTMVKRGSGVFLKTFNRSSVKVLVRTEKDFGNEIRCADAGIFNFEDMDFDNFTFNTSGQYIVPFNTKVKRYKSIQIILQNSETNQGFGVFSIIRRFTKDNYIKE